jgi:DNA-binding transcriptional LysR family regulator
MRDGNWDDLRFVLGVSRARSFSVAARRLGVNESTVVRRIVQLERRLRARLFDRSRGGVRPTEAGLQIIGRAERIELEVQAAETSTTGGDERAIGKVRVTSVPALVNRVLVPQLPSLLSRHPDLQIELVADGNDLSLTKREADVALRLARPHKEASVVARNVGCLAYGVYCSARCKGEELRWINYEDSMKQLPQAKWINDHISRTGDGRPQILVNDAETVLHCVKAGLGKSLLPVIIGDHEADLVRTGSSPIGSLSREIWLLVHPELRNAARIRVVVDWLKAIAQTVSSDR